EIARTWKQRPFLVWLGSVYQLLFASLGSCCGVHHSPQNSGGMVGGSALAALAPSAVAAAAAISRLFIVASSGSDGIVNLILSLRHRHRLKCQNDDARPLPHGSCRPIWIQDDSERFRTLKAPR